MWVTAEDEECLQRRDGVLCGSVLPVCILERVHSDADAVLGVSHDQSLKALHDYRGEGYWPVVIQAGHWGCVGVRGAAARC